MEIKAILCDVGGVLVRTTDTSGRHKWEKKLGLPQGQLRQEIFSRDEGNLATIGLVEDTVIWQELQKKFSLSNTEIKQLYEDFFSGEKLNTGLYDYLMSIRDKLSIVLISNAWSNARKIYTRQYHLDRLSHSMIISAEVGIRKPDEKIYKLALDELKIKPENILFIDDTVENIIEAKKLGMHPIHFIHTQKTIDTIQKFLD